VQPSSRSEGRIFSNRKFRLRVPRKHLAASLPNLFMVLRIFLKLPVSTATVQHAQLPKLKLINTYQHTTQHTLYGLTKLSRKYAITKNVDKEKLTEKLHN